MIKKMNYISGVEPEISNKMNEDSIKHVLKVAIWTHDKRAKALLELSRDVTMEQFYTAGPNIVSADSFPELSNCILPAIIYFPPDKDAEIKDYWSVAVCKGPVDGGITTLPFSYRPWELRLSALTSNNINEQWYTFVVMMAQWVYIPKEVLILIHSALKKSKGYNTGFKIH